MSEIKTSVNAKKEIANVVASNIEGAIKKANLTRFVTEINKSANTKGTNNMYVIPPFVFNAYDTKVALKAFRKIMREKVLLTMFAEINNSFVSFNKTKDNKALIASVKHFISAYKCFYSVNDFSISSIIGVTSDIDLKRKKEFAEILETVKDLCSDFKINISEISANHENNYSYYGFTNSRSAKFNFEK